MSSRGTGLQRSLCDLVVAGAIALFASTAFAQESSHFDSPVVAAEAGVDVSSQYLFRGVRQNSTGMVVWPFTDLTARLLSGEGTLRRVEASVGFWNSLNTGDTGAEGPAGRAWYESRLSGTLGFRFSRGVSVEATYTAYVSPNDMFSTVKEVEGRLAFDHEGARGARAVNAYALLAVELATSPGVGQLDGGLKAGTYLELGATPEFSSRNVSVEFPVKVGLSLGDYYELGTRDHTFGFVSVAGIVAVPLGRATRVGRWHVRGGLEFQSLGETTKVFNGGDRLATVASFGFGLQR